MTLQGPECGEQLRKRCAVACGDRRAIDNYFHAITVVMRRNAPGGKPLRSMNKSFRRY